MNHKNISYTKNITRWFISIVAFVSIFIFLPSCSNKNDNPEAILIEIREKAINCFNKKLYFKDLKKEDRQNFIDALTGNKHFSLISDEVAYKETGHFNFPFTANRSMYFENGKDKSETISISKLFLYDSENYNWLPISEEKHRFEDKKVIKTEQTNLWDEGVGWSDPQMRLWFECKYE